MANYSSRDVIKFMKLYHEVQMEIFYRGGLTRNYNTGTLEEAISLFERYMNKVPEEVRKKLDVDAEGLIKRLRD